MTDWLNQYGYWVGPAGEIHGLPNLQGHIGVASEIWRGLGRPNTEYNRDSYHTLYSLGWVPIGIARNSLCLNFEIGEEPTVEQLSAMQRIVRAHGQIPGSTFYIDCEEYVDDRSARLYLSTLMRRERTDDN